MSIEGWMDKGMNKENVVYAYNRILFSCKMKSKQTNKKNLLSYATTWMKLVDIMLIMLIEMSVSEGQILHDSTYMSYLK